ncbi:hypothetical protein [Leadbetterella sp. DM7]|uniref:hypothetical protein n=1 Tax=Leadbetterella sp. DM7 TaxID=3235085 RepID=UPI00349E9705
MDNTERISTKEFLKSTFNYFRFLGSNWQLLLIVLVAGNLYDMAKNNYFTTTKSYGAAIEFNIDLEGNANSQFGGLATAFMGNASNNSGLMDITNFPMVIMSRTVFENALMTETELFGKKDLFVNFFIDSSDIKTKEWGGNFFKAPSSYAQVKFEKKKPADLTPFENQVMGEIVMKLEGDTHMEKQQGTSIYNLSAKLTNELLAKAWVEILLSATEDFYTEMKTRKTRKLITIQQRRVDSLSVLLRGNDTRLARATFEQPDVVNPLAGMTQTKLTRDNTYLSNLYFTSLNSLDNLNNLLVEQTQFFQILTPVKLPLVADFRTGISVRLTGLILLIATIFFISIRKSYLDIMSE